MGAEQLTRQRSFLAVFAILYALASLIAFVSGGRAIFLIPWGSMDPWIGIFLFLTLHGLLGPIGFLVYATRGWGYASIADWSLVAPAVVLYAVSTVLLAGCLVLASRQNRLLRWSGYVTSTITWLGSGFLMSMILAYGA